GAAIGPVRGRPMGIAAGDREPMAADGGRAAGEGPAADGMGRLDRGSMAAEEAADDVLAVDADAVRHAADAGVRLIAGIDAGEAADDGRAADSMGLLDDADGVGHVDRGSMAAE